MPLSKREAFKVAFLERCAMDGLTPEEMLDRADVALQKLAGFMDFVTTPYNKAWDVAGRPGAWRTRSSSAASPPKTSRKYSSRTFRRKTPAPDWVWR